MNRDKINAGIDRAADAAKETVDLLSERIDAATRCARQKREHTVNRLKEDLLDTTDGVEEAVNRAADRIREKLKP